MSLDLARARLPAVLGGLLALVVACQTVVAPSAVPSAIATTCGEWERLPRPVRRDLIARVIESEGMLEGVRLAQRMAPGTSRDALIGAAVGSIDKNCMIMRDPAHSIVELARQLYK